MFDESDVFIPLMVATRPKSHTIVVLGGRCEAQTQIADVPDASIGGQSVLVHIKQKLKSQTALSQVRPLM